MRQDDERKHVSGIRPRRFSIDDLWAREPDLERLREAYLKFEKSASGLNALEALAARGSTAARWYLGDAYYHGKNVAKDLNTAEKYFAELAESDVPFAFLMLGRISLEKGDEDAALRWFEMGENAGYLPCLYRRGALLFDRGNDDESSQLGKHLLEAAVREGNLHARRTLGLLYMKGRFGLAKCGYGVYLISSMLIRFARMIIISGGKVSEFDERLLG